RSAGPMPRSTGSTSRAASAAATSAGARSSAKRPATERRPHDQPARSTGLRQAAIAFAAAIGERVDRADLAVLDPQGDAARAALLAEAELDVHGSEDLVHDRLALGGGEVAGQALLAARDDQAAIEARAGFGPGHLHPGIAETIEVCVRDGEELLTAVASAFGDRGPRFGADVRERGGRVELPVALGADDVADRADAEEAVGEDGREHERLRLVEDHAFDHDLARAGVEQRLVPVDLARLVEEGAHRAELEVVLELDPFAELHLEPAAFLE